MLHNFFKYNCVFSLHQLIRLIILCIKILKYSYQKMKFTRYFTFYVKMYEFYQLISQRVFNRKEFYCNVPKNS